MKTIQMTKMPTDSTLRFTNVHKQMTAPFVAYADFECILKDVRNHEGEEVNTETNITNTAQDVGPKTKIYQEHVPCRFDFKIVSIDSNYDPEIVIYIKTTMLQKHLLRHYNKRHQKPLTSTSNIPNR